MMDNSRNLGTKMAKNGRIFKNYCHHSG